MASMGTTAFGRATTVQPEGAGRYAGFMPPDWKAPVLPHGGVATAIALRAAEEELAEPAQTLRSVTTVFAGQVHPGSLRIDVSVLRRGRSLSQVVVDLTNADADAGHHVVAVFGAHRAGFEFTDIQPPDAASLDDARIFEPPPELEDDPGHFFEHVESRLALGDYWGATDWEPNGASDRAYWYRFVEPPRRDDGALDPGALVALCDTMPGAAYQRMGPDAPDGFCPSADLTVHILQDSRSEWLLAHNRARHAGDGYVSLEMRLWDPETGLVAYGTQVSFFSFQSGLAVHQVRPPS